MSKRREELLTLAESLIEEQGLESFSLGNLARAAGIRTPSLYKHFSSLSQLEHLLISRGFDRFAAELDRAARSTATKTDENAISQLAYVYHAYALAHPNLYRLMTERTLDRTQLTPGSEQAAMSTLLQYFDESPESHDRARAVWAAAHGMVSLELAGRFPPGADLTGAWEALIDAFSH